MYIYRRIKLAQMAGRVVVFFCFLSVDFLLGKARLSPEALPLVSVCLTRSWIICFISFRVS